MKSIKLICIDIDGVILKDNFSPVLRQLVINYNGTYSRDVERNVFSKNQKEAAIYLIKKFNIAISPKELISEYFTLREEYIEKYDAGGLRRGVIHALKMLETYDIPMVSYGGLEYDKLHYEYKKYSEMYFESYICTNDFRPGMKEIIDRYNVSSDQVLFFDDVNTVAETCLNLGTAFIGVPSELSWSWQKSEMRKTGVSYILSSLGDLTKELLTVVDNDVRNCFTK